MENLDLLYKAYKEYKKFVIKDDETPRFLRAYETQNLKEHEDTVHIFNICKINEDWVLEIEKGLPFIEKAIKEERQFIRNDGEVLPIEKVRKTSTDSIRDLAKHANYITHEAPEDAESEVMPDKMLVIRKESDFAIYENRVVYAALVYLKDFVMSRLEAIKNATNTYQVKQHIDKLIDMGSRKVDVHLTLDESRKNDPILMKNNKEKDVIDRLDVILTSILAFLKTPLMKEVSKAEMVSRPIQKTNILKMNRNFRESLALFDYVASYQGDGYSIEHIEKSYYPISKEMNESYSETLTLLSFLNYVYTNEIQNSLEDTYQENLKKEQIEKENEILEKLREFHAKAKEKDKTINEYLILFEEGYRILEKRNDELNIRMKTIEAEHQAELEAVKVHAEEEIAKANKAAEKRINDIENEKEEAINSLVDEYEAKIVKLREDNNISIAAMSTRQREEQQAFKESFQAHIDEMEEENARIKQEGDNIKSYVNALEAELMSYKVQKSLVREIDFTNEEEFDHLEELKVAFDKFYENAWKEAKKKIRKEVFFSRKPKKDKKTKEEVLEESTPIEEIAPLEEAPTTEPLPVEEPLPEEVNIEEQPLVEEIPNEEEVKEDK